LSQARNNEDKRVAIKLKLSFGTSQLNNMGFTEDISSSGIFIKSAVVYPSNTEIGIELIMSEGEVVRMKGLVNWSKGVAPNLVWAIKDAGMGVKIIKIIQGQDHYYRALVGKGVMSETDCLLV